MSSWSRKASRRSASWSVSYPSYLRTLEHYDVARGQVDLAWGFVLGATVYLGFFFTWRGVLAIGLLGEGLVRLLGGRSTARLLEPTNVVEHEGRDFLCERVEDGVPPRPYRYLLRPLRDGEVVRKRVFLGGRSDASARTPRP